MDGDNPRRCGRCGQAITARTAARHILKRCPQQPATYDRVPRTADERYDIERELLYGNEHEACGDR